MNSMRDYNDSLSTDNKPIDMKSKLQSSRNGRNFSHDMPPEIFSAKSMNESKRTPLASEQGSNIEANRDRYKQALKDKLSD